MTEERKHAILFAATILLARKLLPTLETETPDLTIEHYQWRAIHQASRILEKIDEKWPLAEKANRNVASASPGYQLDDISAQHGHRRACEGSKAWGKP